MAVTPIVYENNRNDTTDHNVNESVPVYGHDYANADYAAIEKTAHHGQFEINMKCSCKCDTYPLRICSWNIEGLNEEKFHIMENFLRQFDIILLSEIWCHADDMYNYSGYTFVNFARKEKHPDAIRMSGGLGFLIKNEIKHGIKIGKHFKDIIAWIVLKNEHLQWKVMCTLEMYILCLHGQCTVPRTRYHYWMMSYKV